MMKHYIRDLLKKPEESQSAFRFKDMLFFYRFVRPAWKLGVSGLFLTIIITALGSLLPLSSKVIIDFVVMKEGFHHVEGLLKYLNMESFIPAVRHFLGSLNLIVISIFAIGLVIGLAGLLQRYLMLRFQQEVTFNLQTALFDHLLIFPLSFFKQKQTGYLMSRVSDDVDALQYIFSESLSQIITRVFYLLFGIAILLALSVKLTVISISILPVYVFINYYFAGRLRSVSWSEREASARVSEGLHEVISGVEVIKSHAAEEREAAKVSGKLRTVIRTRIKAMVLSLLSDYSARGTQLLSTLLIMWFGVQEILKGSMTIGDYVAFTAYIVYLSGSVNMLSTLHIMLQPMFASMDRLMELFSVVPETGHERTHALKQPDKIIGDIVFKDVSFSYEQDAPVLKNINFNVHPGEVIALVGPSGSGKTTLINLMLKFYQPQSGSICLDGHDLRDLDFRWLRQRIGVVSQDVFLFNDTIENNIRYGNPHSTREEVINASRMAHIHDDIEKFADKYDTVVGERGAKLSAGQRQRISIARAFLKNPAILIFDEPTSALDEETERLLKDSLKALFEGRTTFIISHRMSVIDVAGRIFALEGGRLRETGETLIPAP